MLIRSSIYLPEELIAKARSYSLEHRITLTALIIEQLEAVIGFTDTDPMVMFSRGLITKEQAAERAGFRDYAELLVAMDDADLPLPALSESVIDEQVKIFTELWGNE